MVLHSEMSKNFDFSLLHQGMVDYVAKIDVTSLGNNDIVFLSKDLLQKHSSNSGNSKILGTFLMKIRQDSIELLDRNQNEKIEFLTKNILFCSYYLSDDQYFCFISSQKQLSCDFNPLKFCHILRTNSKFGPHSKHKTMALSFNIQCSTNELGNCAEFPTSSVAVVHVLRHLIKQKQPTTPSTLSPLKKYKSSDDVTSVDDSDFVFKKPILQKAPKKKKRFSISMSLENLRNVGRTSSINKERSKSKLKSTEVEERHHVVTNNERCRSLERINSISSTIADSEEFMKIRNSADNLSSIEMNSMMSRRSTLSGRGRAHNLPAGRISYWAVSFDNLLQDPLGVQHFREFLTKEFSEENLNFYEACDKLKEIGEEEKLQVTANYIYNTYLSDDAQTPINITATARQSAEEAIKSSPKPDMFDVQQQGVYYLMKLDSYSRFVKSDLYRQCLLCELESKPLPLQEAPFYRAFSRAGSIDSSSSRRSKSSFKNFFNRKRRPKNADDDCISVTSEYKDSLSLHESMFMSDKSTSFCEVIWTDGESLMINIKKDETLRTVLQRLCSEHEININSVEAILSDDNSNHCVDLSKPMTELASQTIIIEKRSSFRVDLAPFGKSLGINARLNKPLSKAIEMVLSNYNLSSDDVIIKNGDTELDLKQPVSTVDGCHIKIQLKQRPRSQSCIKSSSREPRVKVSSLQRDTDELFRVVSSMQRARLDDQCGLISQTDLELPDFLKINNHNSNCNIDPSDSFLAGVSPPKSRQLLKDVPMANFTPPPPLHHESHT